MSRVALVTGGSRGIGAAISKALKAAGYKVAANYAGNDEAAQKFKSETGISVYKWDVSSYDACAAGIKQVEADLGPVEVLVNNAGITRDGVFRKMSSEDWRAVMDTNLNSLFNVTKQVIDGMVERGFGRIINISSVAGREVYPNGNVYCASKFAVDALSKSMRIDLLPHSIKVTAINPGAVETEFSFVRYKGDSSKADATYLGYTALTPMDIANAIFKKYNSFFLL